MDKVLKIVFSKKTRSKNLSDALRLAYKMDGVLENETVKLELDIFRAFNLWENVNSLLNIIDKWRSFEIYYKNRLCTIDKDYKRLFYAIQDTRRCYFDTIDSMEPCVSDWGCKSLIQVSLTPVGSRKKWYQFGRFVELNVWQVDKDKVLQEITKEASRKFVSACPAFSFNKIKEALDKLPNRIVIDDNWEVDYGEVTTISFKRDVSKFDFKSELFLNSVLEKFSYQEGCPFDEGSPEWYEWMIDNHIKE